MATSLQIKSLTANADGEAIDALLDGTPTGTAVFKIHRTPNIANATLAGYSQSGSIYRLQTPHMGLWYVWAGDDNGFAAEPSAVWTGLSARTDTDLIGEKVRSLLEENKKGLDAAWRLYFPQGEVKQFVYGMSANILAFPSVVVYSPRVTETWYSFPMTKWIETSLSVGFTIIHEDETSLLAASVHLARAGMRILNTPEYTEFTLDNGWNLTNCQAQGMSSSEFQLGNRFCAATVINWACEALVTDSNCG